MPHRVNSKGDIGTAKKFSDSYDMDNIYLSEEGWVYRHFKNAERTLWWDEIIVAGQVHPGHKIHNVDNGPGLDPEASNSPGSNTGVLLTNPLKLGTTADPGFQEGDGVFDYRYSDHRIEGADPDENPPIVSPTATPSIGNIEITGSRNVSLGANEGYDFTITGGNFAKGDVTYTWSVLDSTDAESGMVGQASLLTSATASPVTVQGDAEGTFTVVLTVTHPGADNSPKVEIYTANVV